MPVPNNIPLPGTIGDVNDTTSGYSPFGPPSNNTQFAKTSPDERSRDIKPQTIIPDVDLSSSENTNYGVSGGTLSYPLENSNPAYQARVTFKMFSFQPTIDGKSQKNFSSIAKDNLKFQAKSDDKVKTDDAADVYSDGFEEYGKNFADATGVNASKEGTSGGALSDKIGGLRDALIKGGNKLSENEFIQTTGRIALGGMKLNPVPGASVVDMYFPLTMQFNDNAQYHEAELGALGAATEALVRSGAGALSSVVNAAGQGVESIFDLMRGNQQLKESALRVGAARAIDLGSFLNSGVANALRLTNRAVVNPNLRALFKGVNLREFTFQFKMIAESQQEAEIVQRIIKHFRTEMYPATFPININESVTADLGYQFPNLFKIEFKYRGGQNLRLPQIRHCYLRNVSTTINPTGGTFRRDGQPNEIDLTLTFVEFRTLNKKDIEEGY